MKAYNLFSNLLNMEETKTFLSDTTSRMSNHYRLHPLSVWLNLIPRLHLSGSDNIFPQHNAFVGHDDPSLFTGVVRPASFAHGYQVIGLTINWYSRLNCLPHDPLWGHCEAGSFIGMVHLSNDNAGVPSLAQLGRKPSIEQKGICWLDLSRQWGMRSRNIGLLKLEEGSAKK